MEAAGATILIVRSLAGTYRRFTTEKVLRQQASEIVDYLGGKADVAGFGTFTITAPSQTIQYDSKELDRLVVHLISSGYEELAKQITSCRKESSRAGSLRINRARPGKGEAA
jgi:hypothetical protein